MFQRFTMKRLNQGHRRDGNTAGREMHSLEFMLYENTMMHIFQMPIVASMLLLAAWRRQ
jgi:hypothetical protein